MKRYQGNLSFNKDAEYILTGGDLNEIGKELSELLMDKVHIKVSDGHKNKVILDETGILNGRNDLGGRVWRLWIDDICLDEVLFDMSDKTFNKTVIEYEVVDSKVKYKNNLEVIAK